MRFFSLLYLLLFATVMSANSTSGDLRFSQFDHQVEQTAIKYGANAEQMLAELAQLENIALTHAEQAYLLGYQCYLAYANKQADLAQITFDKLQQQKTAHPNETINSAVSFCNAWRSLSAKDTKSFDINIEKAYQHSAKSEAIVLNYWISIAFSSVAQSTGRHNVAIEATQTALEIAQANNDGYRAAEANSILALSLSELGFYDEALNSNQAAIDWYSKHNVQANLLTLYQNRGYIYTSQGELEQALAIYNKTISLAKKLNNQYSIHSVYTNLAALAFRSGDLAKSNDYALKTLSYAEQHNYQELVAYANSILAINYAYLGDLEKANAYLKRGNDYFEQYQILDSLLDNYQAWADAMADLGDFKSAYAAHVKFKSLNDQIFDAQRESSMLRLKALFQEKQKDKEIERLAILNQRNQAEIANKALQQKLGWLSAATGALLVLLLVFMYRNLAKHNQKLKSQNRELDKQRFFDPLTQTYNRRYFDMVEAKRLTSSETGAFTLLALDIDHFKKINDNYGHAAGDFVLKEFANRIKSAIRESDTLVRMGGEEFLLILHHCKFEQGQQAALKVLRLIDQTEFAFESDIITASVSIGGVSVSTEKHIANIAAIIDVADKLLYQAKQNGRNRAVLLPMQDSDINTETTSQAFINSVTVS